MRVGQGGVNEDELDGFTIIETSVPSAPLQQEPVTVHLSPLSMDIFTETLRDVLVELKTEDRKKQRLKQHNMTLRELRIHQRQRTLA